jgi:integrase
MNEATPFVISEFKNPSGEIVFRVSGQLDGKRVRKNFSTRAEAVAERKALEIARVQAETGIRTAITRLTDEQLQEAEAAFLRLKDCQQSLSVYLDFALANYRAPQHECALCDAVAEYLTFKQHEHGRGIISAVQVGSIKKELALLRGHFPDSTMAPLTAEKLTAFCERGQPSLKTYNNRRGILSTFFKFAFQKDWIARNPVEKIPYHRIAHRRGSARTLSVTQAQELMAFVENHEGGQLVPFFALCLFAGIRPCVRNGEVTKLKPEDINLDTGVIHVEPEVSKVRMKRNVTIQPNLAAWLRAYPLERFPIIPPNLQHTRAAIAMKFDLSKDVMRHTFVSMFVAKFRSMGEAALQAGNSESIIRKHYLDLKSKEEAEQFWGILPQHTAPAAGVTPFGAAPAPTRPSSAWAKPAA